MRLTHRVSWMVSGWIETANLGSRQGGTAALTIGCPDDFFAVRLGFPNVSLKEWRLTKVIGAASEAYGDYINPTGAARWVTFTSAMQGADDDRIVTAADAPTALTVAAAEIDPASGETREPRWTFTDWAPLTSHGADPETGMRVLMLRGLVPSGQIISHAVGQFRGLLGNRALNRGFETFTGGLKFDYDRVTDPASSVNDTTAMWKSNQIANGAVFPLVQFLTKSAGIVGMVTGDSHQQGTATSDQFTGFLYRATTALGSRSIGRCPVGMVNCAAGGLTSSRFFSRLSILLPTIRPSFVVLPGWTYNDTTDGVHADSTAIRRFSALLLTAIEQCHALGCLPICLTPMPRDAKSMTPVQLGPWLALREIILHQSATGTLVLDAAAILGARNGALLDGTYRQGLSNDGRHPNDSGHQTLSEHLLALLGQVIAGLPRPPPHRAG